MHSVVLREVDGGILHIMLFGLNSACAGALIKQELLPPDLKSLTSSVLNCF